MHHRYQTFLLQHVNSQIASVPVAVSPMHLAISSSHVKMMAIVQITTVFLQVIYVNVHLDSMVVNVNMIFDHVNQILVGMAV